MSDVSKQEIDLAATRERLIARRDALLTRVGKLERDQRRQAHGELDKDSAERAVQLENDEVVDALDDAARAEIGQIQAALERLEQGRYRTCTSCGQAIDPRRLDALPYTTVCIDCAN